MGAQEFIYPTAPLHPTLDGRPIPNGAHRSVRGSKGRWYTVCNHSGVLYCDCPAFAFANPPVPCKHIRELRAEHYKPRTLEAEALAAIEADRSRVAGRPPEEVVRGCYASIEGWRCSCSACASEEK